MRSTCDKLTSNLFLSYRPFCPGQTPQPASTRHFLVRGTKRRVLGTSSVQILVVSLYHEVGKILRDGADTFETRFISPFLVVLHVSSTSFFKFWFMDSRLRQAHIKLPGYCDHAASQQIHGPAGITITRQEGATGLNFGQDLGFNWDACDIPIYWKVTSASKVEKLDSEGT